MGIIFLGTPHFGSELASWGELGAKLLSITHTNKKILTVLQRDSDLLAEVQIGFDDILEKRRNEGTPIKITCFYEEYCVPMLDQLVCQTQSGSTQLTSS